MGDFSTEYTQNKKAHIAIGFGSKVIQFKPFIDSLTFTIDRTEPESIGNIYKSTPTVGPFKSSRYSLGFSVLATNYEEAEKNHKRFQILARMVCPDELTFTRNRYLFVQFANLISSKGAPGSRNATIAKLVKNGFECIIKKVSYKPIMDLGFLESNGFVFAKGFSLSLELINRPADNAYQQPIKQSGYDYGRKTGVVKFETGVPIANPHVFGRDDPEDSEPVSPIITEEFRADLTPGPEILEDGEEPAVEPMEETGSAAKEEKEVKDPENNVDDMK